MEDTRLARKVTIWNVRNSRRENKYLEMVELEMENGD